MPSRRSSPEQRMEKAPKTRKQLADLVQSVASVKIGTWPRNMQMFIYPLEDSWRVLVGFSEVADAPYRDAVMALAAELREQYDLCE